jgi:hypothetical protein
MEKMMSVAGVLSFFWHVSDKLACVLLQEHSPLELPQVNREAPLTAAEWTAAFDPEGRIPEPEKLKARIFKGGVEPDLRREVWKFLLGYFPWNSTSSERQALREAKSFVSSYYCLVHA